MSAPCGHRGLHYFSNYPFSGPQTPTDAEINKFRLYLCRDCQKWYSLIGAVKKKEEEQDGR
jgi:hypothetical protein